MNTDGLITIEKLVADSSLFAHLECSVIQSIASKMSVIEIGANEFLFQQGESTTALYLVMNGHLTVYTHGADNEAITLAEVTPGQCIGEMAMFFSGKRSASIRADTPAMLLKLEKPDFEQLINTHISLRRLLGKLIEERLPTLRIATADLFGSIDDELLLEFQSLFTWHTLKRGEILFRQGETGDTIYLIVNGRLELTVNKANGNREVVADLGRGEWVGEMAILLNETRTVTVTATRDCGLVSINRDGLNNIFKRHPNALMSVVETLSKRLKATTLGLKQSSKTPPAITITIVPLSPSVPQIPESIINELKAAGSFIRFTAAKFNKIHGDQASETPFDNPRSLHLNEWQSRQEENHRYIIYSADAEPTEWTKRCLKQADRILLVDFAANDPAIRPVEKLIEELEISSPVELVLLHNKRAKRTYNTLNWLENRSLRRHHHIREGSLRDSKRVGRLLTERATGLVLSGGGARGFAHIGVIKALRENRIPIDAVGGTSMGAYIAALFAMGLDHKNIVENVRQLFLDDPKGIHYTLPYTSLMAVDRSQQILIDLLDDIHLEDLWINCFCVSTNLTRSQMQIHRRGLLWRALRATTALPGVFPPLFEGDDILVDGGVVNVLPIDVMEQENMGRLIACDVTTPSSLRSKDFTTDYINLPQKIINHLNPLSEPVRAPSASLIMAQSMDLGAVMHKQKNLHMADIYLAPPVSHFSLLDMTQLDSLVEVGYRYTMDYLEKHSY